MFRPRKGVKPRCLFTRMSIQTVGSDVETAHHEGHATVPLPPGQGIRFGKQQIAETLSLMLRIDRDRGDVPRPCGDRFQLVQWRDGCQVRPATWCFCSATRQFLKCEKWFSLPRIRFRPISNADCPGAAEFPHRNELRRRAAMSAKTARWAQSASIAGLRSSALSIDIISLRYSETNSINVLSCQSAWKWIIATWRSTPTGTDKGKRCLTTPVRAGSWRLHKLRRSGRALRRSG